MAGKKVMVIAKVIITPPAVNTPKIFDGLRFPVINEKKPTAVVRLVNMHGNHIAFAALVTALTWS